MGKNIRNQDEKTQKQYMQRRNVFFNNQGSWKELKLKIYNEPKKNVKIINNLIHKWGSELLGDFSEVETTNKHIQHL